MCNQSGPDALTVLGGILDASGSASSARSSGLAKSGIQTEDVLGERALGGIKLEPVDVDGAGRGGDTSEPLGNDKPFARGGKVKLGGDASSSVGHKVVTTQVCGGS